MLDFMFLNNNNSEAIIKRATPYEVALFLKSYPDGDSVTVWETMRNIYNDLPPTWWLVERIVAEYGHDPLWIKVPASMLGLVEAVKQPPKRRWRTSGKWKKLLPQFHQPWWMKWWSFHIMWQYHLILPHYFFLILSIGYLLWS